MDCLITDAYSMKIVDYVLCPKLEAAGCIEVLIMVVSERRNTLIHHSDRGIQYCSRGYIEILQRENIAISMTQTGSPYKNTLEERMHGVKKEFFPKRIYQNHKEANKAIDRIVRPSSLDYLRLIKLILLLE
ncbi:DDE-type integrase/transposase/recombinase [Elizabethkingia miricola]|uniref:DDE-type integrase/transposase/recombinase n=1 Tax=Elizabethkingia miricola TaxID=172045 RepID=UPI002ACE00B8|nr:DDE-type integrase/transposase/recombinase [Elizabethkingia miricola]WQM39419.1 hypothetical protein U2S95_03970 [Elizabethkingia miricola]